MTPISDVLPVRGLMLIIVLIFPVLTLVDCERTERICTVSNVGFVWVNMSKN